MRTYFCTTLFITLFSTICLADSYSIQVDASPIWTDTHITLLEGQYLTISASGSWTPGGPEFYGPEGLADSAPNADNFLASANWSSLIGYIGESPFQGQLGNRSFFPQETGYLAIGSSFMFRVTTLGKFWLGINDDSISGLNGPEGNSGFMIAEVDVPDHLPMLTTFFALATILILGSQTFSTQPPKLRP